jgi:hypothetical protein
MSSSQASSSLPVEFLSNEEPIAKAEHTFMGIGEGKIGEICKTGSWRKTRRDEVQVVQALLDWGTKSKEQKREIIGNGVKDIDIR